MDAVTAWKDFCDRMAALGASVLRDPMVTDDRARAEGIRHLTRQVTFALRDAVEFDDPRFPALHRYDDDVTKWGGPNADNNYLRCRIDPAGTYRLRADVTGCRELIISLGEGDMQLGAHRVTGDVSLRDLDVPDGRLEVIVAPTEHTGNWIRTEPWVTRLTIRIYVADWLDDTVPRFEIDRLDDTPDRPPAMTLERAAAALDTAAHWVETSVPFWLRYLERARPAGMDNVMFSPGGAKGGAADIAYGAGYWNLDDDEAWLIEFDEPDADHWSIQTHTWPWFESGDVAHAQTSLNDTQAHVDTDGRVRVVVAHRDPGVPNWIDTEGRPVGMVAYRWIWARTTPTPSTEVLALDALLRRLPEDHPRIDPATRRETLARRRRGIHRRFRR